jgi:hypothetical protein
MPILRGVLGKVPSGPKSRVRNFIANKESGTQSDIHENVISPGVTVPWHFHETEEVIVVLEGGWRVPNRRGHRKLLCWRRHHSSPSRKAFPEKFRRYFDTPDLLLSERPSYQIPRGRLPRSNSRYL